MNPDFNRLSPHERALLDLLKKHGIKFSSFDASEVRDFIASEIKEFFSHLKTEGLTKLFDALYRKGFLLRDNQGWYKLRGIADGTEVAIVGKITAGHLREAVGDTLGYVEFAGPLPQPHQLFAFQVEGDSMIGDDIESGDCVLLRKVEVRDGQVGAVIVDGETTLKRIYKEHGMLRLEPSNPYYEPIHILNENLSSCRVLGRLEAIISHRTGNVTWFSTHRASSELTIFLN